MVLQKELGEQYDVVEEGLSARTTTLDEIVPGRPYKNGLTQLPVCLESHYPIDLVVFWLGTNDTKIQFDRSAKEIAEGMRQLIHVIKSSNKGQEGRAPEILLTSPQPIVKIPNLHPQVNDSSIEKSKTLVALYEKLAKEEDCAFLDASLTVTSSQTDGVHLDELEHSLLGKIIAQKVKQIFSQ